jgi:hypothetical protein
VINTFGFSGMREKRTERRALAAEDTALVEVSLRCEFD